MATEAAQIDLETGCNIPCQRIHSNSPTFRHRSKVFVVLFSCNPHDQQVPLKKGCKRRHGKRWDVCHGALSVAEEVIVQKRYGKDMFTIFFGLFIFLPARSVITGFGRVRRDWERVGYVSENAFNTLGQTLENRISKCTLVGKALNSRPCFPVCFKLKKVKDRSSFVLHGVKQHCVVHAASVEGKGVIVTTQRN